MLLTVCTMWAACAEMQHATSLPECWVSAPRSGFANWAADAWKVDLVPEGRTSVLRFSPTDGRDGTQISEVSDGRIVSENRGEFGGDVWWEPLTGVRQLIARTNLVRFVRIDGQPYGLIDSGGMVTSAGSLVRFDRTPDTGWKMEHMLDLGATPFAVSTAEDGELLVVLSGALASVQLPDRVTIVHRNSFWGLSPNSVVRDRSGTIYIGMRSGVVRLTPVVAGRLPAVAGREFVEDWLVKTDCPIA
jgi:hypothetical protein